MALEAQERVDLRNLDNAERSQLVSVLDRYQAMGNEWLRRQIVVNNRADLLARYVLGYEVQPFHLAMMRWQVAHPNNLILAFRGAGKSTTCTVTKAIHLLIKDRNLRLVLASKSTANSEAFLREIKGHLEGNARLIELFGEFYDPRRVEKWDNREIDILGRTKRTKESSITCVGVDGTIVSKHYDVEFSDDLVDEENARTPYMRGKAKTWYYSTLTPCIEPPDPAVPHRGERHRLGTRYHYDDLWGHFMANELRDHTMVVPALDDEGNSPWASKYSAEFFAQRRAEAGTIIFGAQYKCDTEAMKGEIFQFDDCQVIDDVDIPGGLRTYMGVDLAISEAEAADHFAIVVVGHDPVPDNYYVLDFFDGQLRFNEQTRKIKDFYRRHDPVRACIETNAYQKAQYQALKDGDKDIRLKPVTTDKDKTTRAWKLSPLFEGKRVFFKRNMGPLIDQLVLFPGYRYKDLFDALDLAIRASKAGNKRKRRKTPGLF